MKIDAQRRQQKEKKKNNNNAHKCIRRRILEDNYGQYRNDKLRLMRGAAIYNIHGGEEREGVMEERERE